MSHRPDEQDFGRVPVEGLRHCAGNIRTQQTDILQLAIVQSRELIQIAPDGHRAQYEANGAQEGHDR